MSNAERAFQSIVWTADGKPLQRSVNATVGRHAATGLLGAPASSPKCFDALVASIDRFRGAVVLRADGNTTDIDKFREMLGSVDDFKRRYGGGSGGPGGGGGGGYRDPPREELSLLQKFLKGLCEAMEIIARAVGDALFEGWRMFWGGIGSEFGRWSLDQFWKWLIRVQLPFPI